MNELELALRLPRIHSAVYMSLRAPELNYRSTCIPQHRDNIMGLHRPSATFSSVQRIRFKEAGSTILL